MKKFYKVTLLLILLLFLTTYNPSSLNIFPKDNDLSGLPFHKFFRSTKTVPLVDFVYDLKVFNAIKIKLQLINLCFDLF